MKLFVQKPSIELHPGIIVDKDTAFDFENENVVQSLKDLMFHSITYVHGDGYESTYHTTIYLQEGDVLLFEENGRGYIKPVDGFVSVDEAIKELEIIKPEE